MARRIEIDPEELKRLHGEGLSDTAVGKQLGASGVTIGKLRRGLGITSHRGTRRPPAVANHKGRWTETIARLERERDLVQGAINALLELSQPNN
jgi:hypothetical protein